MSENQGSSGEWVRPPGPGGVVLVAKAGEGVDFPDYLISALKQYEQELRAQQQSPANPELESRPTCGVDCEELEIV
jgi:hypothetical protein